MVADSSTSSLYVTLGNDTRSSFISPLFNGVFIIVGPKDYRLASPHKTEESLMSTPNPKTEQQQLKTVQVFPSTHLQAQKPYTTRNWI